MKFKTQNMGVISGGRSVYRFYLNHIQQLMNGFEPVVGSYKVLEDLNTRKYSVHCIFPTVFFVTLVTDTLILAVANKFKLKDVDLFNHIMMNHTSQFYREQADVIFIGAYWMLLLYFGHLFNDRMPHKKYLLVRNRRRPDILCTPLDKNQCLPRELSEKLIRFSERSKKNLSYINMTTFFLFNLAFTIPFIGTVVYKSFFRSDYQVTFKILLTFVIAPIMMRYLSIVLSFAMSFLFNNHCFRIKQRYYIEGMRKFLSTVRTFHVSEKNVRLTMKRLNKHMNLASNIVSQMYSFNRFFSIYITNSILVFAFIISYILYGIIGSTDGVFVLARIPWTFFAVAYLAFIIAVTSSSSKTTNLNVQIYEILHKIQFNIRAKCMRYLSLNDNIRLDRIDGYQKLMAKGCFRMIVDTPIQ